MFSIHLQNMVLSVACATKCADKALHAAELESRSPRKHSDRMYMRRKVRRGIGPQTDDDANVDPHVAGCGVHDGASASRHTSHVLEYVLRLDVEQRKRQVFATVS